jgi:SOS-response transcriptional repressor LexA
MSETDTRPSKKQRELLTFIEGFIAQHGYGPSYREIMRALDYRSVSTVAVHVDNLIKKGHLLKRDKSARSLEVRNAAEAKASPQAGAKPITKSQEKWLIDAIGAKFAAAEKQAAGIAELDSLYVLVGALHVLGFPDAARSYQGRLQDLKQQFGSAK